MPCFWIASAPFINLALLLKRDFSKSDWMNTLRASIGTRQVTEDADENGDCSWKLTKNVMAQSLFAYKLFVALYNFIYNIANNVKRIGTEAIVLVAKDASTCSGY